MANLSIYQNFLKPPKSIQEYDDEHTARQVNMLGLKERQNALASHERGLADESATREAYAQSAGDQSKVLETLKSKGLYRPAMSIEKAMLDTENTRSDIDGKKYANYKTKQEGLQKALDMSRSFVQGVSNPAEAAMYLKGLYAHPDLGPIISSIKPLEAGLASLPQDPEGLERWKAMHMGMTADKLMAITMPKIDNTNMGGYHSIGATDQFTGRRTETGKVLNTQSPDNAASNARMASDSAASRAVQMRGQNMTDARARENNETSRGGGVVADVGGLSQAALVKQFGKPEAGRRWREDGTLEAIPGGSADTKAALKEAGASGVGSVVAGLRDKYDLLNKSGGIVNQDNSGAANLAASSSASNFGQAVGGAFGTKNQNARDSIAMQRPILLQEIMKATGMSAKQMDSNVELKLYLSTATDPQKGYQANMEALDQIERRFGVNGSKEIPGPKKPEKPAATKSGATVSNW
jgi:hypothetical protein